MKVYATAHKTLMQSYFKFNIPIVCVERCNIGMEVVRRRFLKYLLVQSRIFKWVQVEM